MAVIITVTEVREICATNASDTAIQILIDFVDQADDCLDLNQVPEETQRVLKLYTVCHMLTMQDGGSVKSERDMDGESVTFGKAFDKDGLGATSYGSLIQSMPGYSCIAALIDKPRRYFNVVNY